MASIMQSEAGLMLLAEEFDFLRSKKVLSILLLLATRGPLTKEQIAKSGIGKPYKLRKRLDFLVDQGILVLSKQVYKKAPHIPPKNYTLYYMADEFIGEAIVETAKLLQRSHQAYADGFRVLRNQLKPLP